MLLVNKPPLSVFFTRHGILFCDEYKSSFLNVYILKWYKTDIYIYVLISRKNFVCMVYLVSVMCNGQLMMYMCLFPMGIEVI